MRRAILGQLFMVALLGPILAQMVSLSVADRTEVRAIAGIANYSEEATRPLVAVGSDWKLAHLTLSYAPTLTLTTLGGDNHQLLVFHTGSLIGSYRIGRTLLFAAENVAYGEQSFQQLTLAGGGPNAVVATPTTAGTSPTPAAIGTVIGGTPTTGANGSAFQAQLQALIKPIHYESLSTTVALVHSDSANLTYGGDLSYSVSGAVRESDRADYPLLRGPRASAFTRYGWGHNDSVTSTVSLQYALASTAQIPNSTTPTDSSVWLGVWNETWAHKFDPHATVLLGAGLSSSRSPVPNNGSVVAWTIYPTFNAGVLANTLLARGVLSVSFIATAAPALDLTTVTVDPRVSLTGSAGWARDRFFSSIAGGTAFSISSGQGATDLQSASGAASVGYLLGKAVSVDAGVRGAWQTFAGVDVFPFTYAAFVGVNFGTKVPLR